MSSAATVHTSQRFGGSSTPRVAIIGAGLGGIATAVNLTKRGITSFTVFDKAEGLGGTWWHNRYPGAECDIPSALYSFSFKPHAWTRTHATQAEIQEYLEEVVDEFQFRDRLRLGSGVTRAEWDDRHDHYVITTDGGAEHRADVVVSAVGLLNVPRIMDWPGLDTFTGPAFHSARWDPAVDLTGKSVAVVGAGATAAQVIPTLAPEVARLVTFQREAGWVLPKNDREYDAAESRRLARPWHNRRERATILRGIDKGIRTAGDTEGPAGRALRKQGEDYIAEVFKDRPDLQEMLTPTYAPRCKRIVRSNVYLPALTRPNVEVVNRAVVAATATGVVDDSGTEHRVDAIVMATGFHATDFLSTLDVVGRGGQSIHDAWGDEPEAFLGLTVTGFPNFYILFGPNTNGQVMSYTLERQAEFVARDVVRLGRGRSTAIELRPSFARWFHRQLDKGLASVEAWEAGCNNFYHSASGKNVTQWPWSHGRYWLMTRALRVMSSRRTSTRRTAPAPPGRQPSATTSV